jgi:hypothetical protein
MNVLYTFHCSYTNLFCITDNAVSLDGAKALVAYLEDYAKST